MSIALSRYFQRIVPVLEKAAFKTRSCTPHADKYHVTRILQRTNPRSSFTKIEDSTIQPPATIYFEYMLTDDDFFVVPFLLY